jgi:hypothetical protein
MKKTLFSLAGVFVAIALLLFVGPTLLFPQSAQPKIVWSPSSVYAGITSTTTVIKSVTFTSDQALQNVVLEAVPQIAGFIQIQPNTLAQVPASQPQTIRLIFSAPAAALFGAYDGTIHLRIGRVTLPQTLKTSVTFAVVSLPPDPGVAGKVTLQGIDSDGDGIRDDVERYIGLTYPASARQRAVLAQATLSLESQVLGTASSYQAVFDSLDCMDYTFARSAVDVSGGVATENAYKSLRTVVLNTPDRTNAFFRAARQFGSGVVRMTPYSQESSKCTINPSGLPN